MPDLSGTIIKGYQLQQLLGEGAFGAVYRASQPQVGREVALKVILPEYANRPDFIRRFESEAQLVAQLEHLHIVPLYDYWREPGGAYLVMRLLKGGSLEQSLRENGSWQPAEAARLVDQIASALEAAHKQGVVHRDLKPANILLDEVGNAYLSDFGIAKELGAETGVTQTGAIVGTPAYLTPEQIQSQPVTPQTDLYALGVMLYELLVGGHPFPDTPTGELLVKHLSQPLPLVRDIRPDIPTEVDEVIQKATAKDPAKRYPDALSLAAAFRRALQIEVGLPAVPEGELYNPYKGLRAFQEADAGDFFGREALIGQLLARLVETPSLTPSPYQGEGRGGGRFLAVVGPSGSGKSSVVKAGLIPALRQGALPGSDQWFITEMVPGAHPLEELELALLRLATHPEVNIAEQLNRDERGLLRATRLVIPEGGELLLVVDQLEELFTLVTDPKAAAFFLQSLYEAVVDHKSPVRVVVTLRADFYDRPLMHPDFSRLMQARTEVVVPLSPEELERAIRGPAERVGVLFEQGLVPTIISELVDQPGYLPLLQYALTELFEHRDGRLLTNAAYQAIGSVLGALGRRAEEIYSGLDADAQTAARQLFLRLVTLGEGTEDTRRRVLRSELESLFNDQHATLSMVIDSFGQARLLTFDRDPVTREPTIEVAHEALLREWRRLWDWLDQSRADIRMQRVLGNAATDWVRAEREASFLLRGARLDQFEAWAGTSDLALTHSEQEYLDACLAERRVREAAETERQAHEAALVRRSRNFLRGLVVVMAVATIVALFLVWQQNRQTNIATARELALAAQSSLTVDPELAILLALQSASAWESVGQTVPYDLQETLHQAIPASRARLTWSAGDQEILSVSFIQPGDQPRVVTGDRQAGTVIIWDPLSNQEMANLPALLRDDSSGGGTPNIQLSPDGKQLAVPAEGNSFNLWDLTSGKEICALTNLPEEILDTYFGPDGKYMLTTGRLGYIFWETGSCRQQLEITTSSNFSKAAAFSPDGKTIAAVTEEGQVSFWDVESARQVSTLQAGFNLTALAFSPDGRLLAGAGRENFALEWDVATGQTVVTLTINQVAGGQVEALAYSPDSNNLVIMGSFYDAVTGENLYSLLGHTKPLSDLAFDQRGSRLITSSYDGTVKLWDLSPEHELMTLAHPSGYLYGVAFSPDGKWLATSGQDQTAVIWDALSAEKLWTLQGHSDTVNSVAFSPDGNLLATSGADRVVKVWDTRSWQVLHSLAGYGEDRTGVPPIRGVFAVVFSPLCTNTASGPCPLAGVGHDGQLIVWDALSGQQQLAYQDSAGGLMSVAFSPDGTHLAVGNANVGGGDSWATILDAASGQVLGSFPGAFGWVWGLDYSPDGRELATLNFAGDGTVWDLEGGQVKVALTGIQNGGYSLAYSPDGELLAAGSNGSVVLLDASSGLPLLSLPGHQSLVVRSVLSPDGGTLATASLDGTARLYVVPAEDLLALARSRLTRPLKLEECQKYLHQETCP